MYSPEYGPPLTATTMYCFPRIIRGGGHLSFAGDDQGLRHERPDVVGLLPSSRNVHALQEFGIAHYVRRFSVWDLPDDFAFVQIDRGDGSVRRLDQRQSVDIQAHVLARGPLLRRLWRIGARVFARPAHDLHVSSGDAGNVVEVGNVLGCGNQADGFDAGIARVYIDDMRFRVVGTARPVGSAGSGPHGERAERPLKLAHRRRSVDRAEMIFRGDFFGALTKRRSEIDQVIDRDAVAVVSGRLRRNRLRVRIPFARHGPDFHGFFRHGPDRLPGDAIENVKEALLGGLRDGFDRLSVHGNVREDWRGRNVHVPQGVVHELEVPFPLAGFQVHANQRFAEQIVAVPVAAVEIAGGRFHRQIHEPELLVHADLRPHAGVPGVFRRAV